nr:hypothetical protein GCM10020093_080290 [Planobispora longispora]
MLAVVPESIFRPTARILLVDDSERVMLYRGMGPTKNPEYAWFTPGGGVHPGESLPVAAARELREETGHDVSPTPSAPSWPAAPATGAPPTTRCSAPRTPTSCSGCPR